MSGASPLVRGLALPALLLMYASMPGTAAAASDGKPVAAPHPFTVVLGTAQDGGYPQAGCRRACCAAAWEHPDLRRHVACLALVDPQTGERWLIDATPDLPAQLHDLDRVAPPAPAPPANPGDSAVAPPTPSPVIGPALSGILLTHAHIGHYTGLMQLGREVMGAHAVPVLALPRLRAFLEGNGPWDQLVRLSNITLVTLHPDAPTPLNARLQVTPLLVPHRDEYSETCGFIVTGPQRSVAWIPDIDKWERWETPLPELLRRVDIAYVDGTFYANGELTGRDMSEIPHPFIEETLGILLRLPEAERAKVRFVHLNHTNPALQADGEAQRRIEQAGARVAQEGERVEL